MTQYLPATGLWFGKRSLTASLEHPARPPEVVEIPVGHVTLMGEVAIPADALGVVLFAHGSGSSRHSPRNRHIADVLKQNGIATVLFDLLTPCEDEDENLRFDVALLAERLASATRWVSQQRFTKGLALGFFGASTGGAAALIAAAKIGPSIKAVVSRGGRPDLAFRALSRVKSPVLFIVGECDREVLALNRQATEELRCSNQLELVPNATHLFEEPGALDKVAGLAANWFRQHFTG